MAQDYETLELLIDGTWLQGSEGTSEPVYNPANGAVLGALPHASRADLDAALEASARGFATWSAMPPADRQQVIERAAQLLEERFEAIARTLTQEMGKPLAEARQELGFAINILRWYGEEGKRAYGRQIPARMPGVRQIAYQRPVGPCLAFVAWNFPAVNVMRKVAGALGAGCSLIIKPAEETPGTGIAIARALTDAGLPDGVLNVVFGVPAEVSEYLLASPIPRKLSFTGSVPVGKHLQKLAAATLKRCTMELGGHSPLMVFDDTDVEKVARIAAGGKFRNAGQVCIAPTRFMVQEGAYDRFVDAFTAEAERIKLGNGLEEGTTMGPLIAPRRLEVMDSLVQDAVDQGAGLRSGGARVGNQGSFFSPTVLEEVPVSARIMNEEPFGPVAPISRFETVDAIIEEANRLPFGLASYAFTRSPRTAGALSEGVESGLLAINSLLVSSPETPFGGIKDSGYGHEGGIEGLQAFLQTRLVTESEL